MKSIFTICLLMFFSSQENAYSQKAYLYNISLNYPSCGVMMFKTCFYGQLLDDFGEKNDTSVFIMECPESIGLPSPKNLYRVSYNKLKVDSALIRDYHCIDLDEGEFVYKLGSVKAVF